MKRLGAYRPRVPRAAHPHGSRGNRGLTLVELLVVLAIVALLTAISIPGFVRLGFFSGDELQRSSLELYNFLRASKVYAATYNTHAGMAYGPVTPEESIDSVTGQALAAFKSAGMVYRLDRGVYYQALTDYMVGTPYEDDPLFVPVTTKEGGFRELPDNTCLNGGPANGDTVADPEDSGFRRVPVIFPQQTGEPVFNPVANRWEFPVDSVRFELLYAHVFQPSGALEAYNRERYALSVEPLPNADPVLRFADDENFSDANRRRYYIDLYRSTGRAKIRAPEYNF